MVQTSGQKGKFGKLGTVVWHARECHYLEDHPMTCKWLITMVNISRVVGPLPNGLYKWLLFHLDIQSCLLRFGVFSK